ncbi:hypothetical protein VTO73DRAFT_8498 [Trametes versicolor]
MKQALRGRVASDAHRTSSPRPGAGMKHPRGQLTAATPPFCAPLGLGSRSCSSHPLPPSALQRRAQAASLFDSVRVGQHRPSVPVSSVWLRAVNRCCRRTMICIYQSVDPRSSGDEKSASAEEGERAQNAHLPATALCLAWLFVDAFHLTCIGVHDQPTSQPCGPGRELRVVYHVDQLKSRQMGRIIRLERQPSHAPGTNEAFPGLGAPSTPTRAPPRTFFGKILESRTPVPNSPTHAALKPRRKAPCVSPGKRGPGRQPEAIGIPRWAPGYGYARRQRAARSGFAGQAPSSDGPRRPHWNIVQGARPAPGTTKTEARRRAAYGPSEHGRASINAAKLVPHVCGFLSGVDKAICTPPDLRPWGQRGRACSRRLVARAELVTKLYRLAACVPGSELHLTACGGQMPSCSPSARRAYWQPAGLDGATARLRAFSR